MVCGKACGAAGSALVGSAWRRRLSRPLARSNRAETARGASTVGRRMAGDVWTSSRLAHSSEEQCARNVCQPVYRPQSSPAHWAGAQGRRVSKALVLTKLLRVRGWLGGAYDTQSQERDLSTGPYPHEFCCTLAPVKGADRPSVSPGTTPRYSSLPTISQSHLHRQCQKHLGFVEQQRCSCSNPGLIRTQQYSCHPVLPLKSAEARAPATCSPPTACAAALPRRATSEAQRRHIAAI